MNSEPPWTPPHLGPTWPLPQPQSSPDDLGPRIVSAAPQQPYLSPFQPYGQQPPAPPTSSRPPRTGRIVIAATLLGALAGGAAGIGGAALFDEASSRSDQQTPLVRSGGDTSVGGSEADPAAEANGAIEAAAAEALPSVVKIYAAGAEGNGSGSGIILTDNGQILTNNHVVEVAAEGGKLAVSFSDGMTAEATLLGRDPLTDLAVIQADDVGGLTPATLGDSDSLAVGDQVVAVGAPFGLESTVTSGIVSALNRPVTTGAAADSGTATVFPAIQTDAAINPGNSGGPLIDLDGNVVGINSAIRTDTASAGAPGGSIGLGFAIPVSDAIAIVEQLRAGEPATHARIGVSVGNASDDVGLPGGALVQSVDDGTAADKAGIREGEVITRVDEVAIPDSDSLVATVRSYRPGDTVTLTVTSSRSDGEAVGDPRDVEVKLGSD